jgi:hypothetical protein
MKALRAARLCRALVVPPYLASLFASLVYGDAE